MFQKGKTTTAGTNCRRLSEGYILFLRYAEGSALPVLKLCLSLFFHMDHGSQKKAWDPHRNHTVKATGGSGYDTAGPWSSQQTSWTGEIFRRSCRNLHCPKFSDCFLCLVGGINNSMGSEGPAITERHLEGLRNPGLAPLSRHASVSPNQQVSSLVPGDNTHSRKLLKRKVTSKMWGCLLWCEDFIAQFILNAGIFGNNYGHLVAEKIEKEVTYSSGIVLRDWEMPMHSFSLQSRN